jgi:hypothetical protein
MEMITKMTTELATAMAPRGVMALPAAADAGAAVEGLALGHDGGDTSVAPWCSWCWCVVMLSQTPSGEA